MNARTDHTAYADGRQKLLAHLAMVAFATLVGGSFSFGALAVAHIDPVVLNAVRFAIATGVMAGVTLAMTRRPIRPPAAPWRFLILGVLMALFFITMFTALRYTDPVSTGAVFTLLPLASAGFGWLFLGQPPRAIVVASLTVSALGALWVIFKGDVDALLSFDVGYGETIFFFGVLGHAAYAPLMRRFNRGEPGVEFTLWTVAATGLCIAAWGWSDILATDWSAVTPVAWLAILYLATFTSGGTFFLTQYASMRLPAAKVLAYSTLTPCITILLEGVLGHGWPSTTVLVGAGVILLGLVVMALSRDA